MGTATLYRNFLDIDYPACHEVDVNEFVCGKDNYQRYSEIRDLVETYPLFNPGFEHPYYKGEEYLAQCIFRQEWSKSESETKARLDSLVKYRGRLAPHNMPQQHKQLTVILDLELPGTGVFIVPDTGVPCLKGASQIMETIDQLRLSSYERIRVIIWKFAEIMNCKLRSLPLNTCRRKHLPRDWAGEGVAPGLEKLSLEDGSSC